MNYEKTLWKASGVFAPDYPRQSSSRWAIQDERTNRTEFIEALNKAIHYEMPGYYSVYSFPRGHSSDGNIPKVDSIFIDLDVKGFAYDPGNGKTGLSAWKRDMSALLTRARMIADAILESGREAHFRATLSGHKGLHLYLDFPTVSPNNGSFDQFKNGLKSYGEQVMDGLDSLAGGVNIDPWVDVDASDLGRLARHPNTIHHDVAYDDETRWCVPITIEELSELKVEDYLEYTKEPRWIDGYERTPSESVGDKVVQEIRNASSSKNRKQDRSVYNNENISNYEAGFNPNKTSRYSDSNTFTENESIELEDIEFLTANYPCIKAFVERDDAYDHGNASHEMEINVIGKLAELGVPRDVMHEFLSQIPGYNEADTDEQINTILGREYKSFNCETIAERAPRFCLGDDCDLYRRSDDIQK